MIGLIESYFTVGVLQAEEADWAVVIISEDAFSRVKSPSQEALLRRKNGEGGERNDDSSRLELPSFIHSWVSRKIFEHNLFKLILRSRSQQAIFLDISKTRNYLTA